MKIASVLLTTQHPHLIKYAQRCEARPRRPTQGGTCFEEVCLGYPEAPLSVSRRSWSSVVFLFFSENENKTYRYL